MKLTKTGLKTEYPTHSNVNFLLLMKCILIKQVVKVILTISSTFSEGNADSESNSYHYTTFH